MLFVCMGLILIGNLRRSSIAARGQQTIGDLFLPLQSLYPMHDSVPDPCRATIP
jgi:hypothetical protein